MRFALPSFVSILALAAIPAIAAEPPLPALTWDAKLGFSYQSTSGNTQTSSSGFEAGFNRAWRNWSVEGNAAGVSATRKHRRVAESYNALARLKRRLKKKLLITLGLRWERNRFAGLDSRRTVDLSALWEIRDTPEMKLRALGGLSFGREEPLKARPAADSFGRMPLTAW